MINSKQITITSALLACSVNVYAGSCGNIISSNLIDETIAISPTETISINPWSIIKLKTHCEYDDGWNISSTLGIKEGGHDKIYEIRDTGVSYANLTFSRADYKIEVGRFKNNMSFNSVFGFAAPMRRIPAIQLDEASHAQIVATNVNLVRITKNTGFGSVYVTGYAADRTLDQLSHLNGSFNGGITKPINDDANIEAQYANESTAGTDTIRQRLSVFFNLSGSLDQQTKWGLAMEVNGLKNRDFIPGNDDVTANLYSELSQKDILSNFDAYIAAGGSYDEKNQASLEVGAFLNLAKLLKMRKNLAFKAGAAQSRTYFQDGGDINTYRYSIQFKYEM